MHRGFVAEVWRGLIFVLLCLLFGLITGYLAWTLVIGLSAYSVWILWQIYRLDHWLLKREPGLPPDADGRLG